MKTFYNKIGKSNLTAFGVILFSTVLLFTLWDFSIDTITRESPLLNIAGQPFLQSDFVLIIFSAAAMIGGLLGMLLKKQRWIAPLAVALLGSILTFIFLFTVDSMQIMAPLMRISHVIMTVSRVLSIVAGVSGLFAGLCFASLGGKNVNAKFIIWAIAIGMMLSAVAIAEGCYIIVYALCALVMFCTAIFIGKADEIADDKTKNPLGFLGVIQSIALPALIMVTFFTLSNYINSYLGIGDVGVAAVMGVLLIAVVLGFNNIGFHGLLTGLGMLIGSVCGYVIIHFVATKDVFSGNRVIYTVEPLTIGIVLAVFAIAVIILKISQKKKSR